MRSEFSEFSYGFALTQEVCDLFPERLYAPAFPSLFAEGQEGGGFDVFLPQAAIFLQFKVSDQLTTRAAKESSLLGVPYYRAHIHRRDHSEQHRLLLELESRGNLVFYIAPAFATNAELNQHYTTRAVAHESAFFSPSAIGPLEDNRQHYVVFATAGSPIQFCSRPRPIRPGSVKDLLDAQPEGGSLVADSKRETLEDFGRALAALMIDTYSDVTGKALGPRASADLDPLRRAAALSQVLFNSQLVLRGVA